MKIKLLILGILSALMCLCFVGCQGRVDTKSELKHYLHSNGHWLCSIEEGPVEIGHGDFYWNVYDKTNEIHFTVYQELTEDLYGSVEVFDNYNAKLVEKHIDDFPDHEGIEIDTESSWRGYPILRFEYTNVEDLEKKYEVVEECAEYIDKIKKDMKIVVRGIYSSPRVDFFKEVALERVVDEVQYGQSFTYEEIKNGDVLSEIKQRYFNWGYHYHFPEIEAEISQYDIDRFWGNTYNHPLAIYRSGDPKDKNNRDFVVYRDILCSSGVNIGNLYFLLKKEGFEVVGESDDFTVTNINGQTCHFSYDYADEDYCAYYLIDEEKVPCDGKYYTLDYITVYDLFGLSINEYYGE